MTGEMFEKMKVFLDGFDYRVARSRAELERSFELVYQEYIRQGYIDGHPSGMRFFLHNILPETTTFVAMLDDTVVATATIVPDSPIGLPMDDLYKDEVDELRAKGKTVCEISMLAHSHDLFGEEVSVMLNAKKMFLIFYLFKHLFNYVKEVMKTDYICIAVNPKHATMYNYLYFEDLGELKYYDKVNGAPAMGKFLDVNSVEKKSQEGTSSSLYKMFFTEKSHPSKFIKKFKFQVEDILYFFNLKTDIFKGFSEEKLRYVQECYADYDFSDACSANEFFKIFC